MLFVVNIYRMEVFLRGLGIGDVVILSCAFPGCAGAERECRFCWGCLG